MKNGSTISIIIPVYQAEPYLERCVRSVMAQTYDDLEIILVDDGSTDRCPQICDRLSGEDSRIKVIRKANGGLSSARNAGLDIARGAYIGFVDADDYTEPTMYEDMIGAISGQSGIVAMTGVRRERPNGEVTSELMPLGGMSRTVERDEFCRSLLTHEGDCAVWSKLFPRDVIGDVRFREGRLNEDVLFDFEIMSGIRALAYTGKVGYHHLIRAGSICSTFGQAQHDMVTNAREISRTVCRQYPALIAYAERFEIYQNMMFLNACPFGYRRKGDGMFRQTRRFLARSFLPAMKNPHLTGKEKFLLSVLVTAPRTFSFLRYLRHGKTKSA